jgi:ribosomal protein S18 acetylase RimI-like enzyme
MTDQDFIIGLMRTETDALGFIPAPTVRNRFIAQGNYRISTDRSGKRRGYLLHGPIKPGHILQIHQACVEYDKRLRGHGIQMVDRLIADAASRGAPAVLLRCAAELDAVDFWKALGFNELLRSAGGARRNRQIITFCRRILPIQTLI